MLQSVVSFLQQAEKKVTLIKEKLGYIGWLL
uniref:Uncharacterized protein n=1 Tax=Tetranychus urticae TaxID=32264 RepID=T1KQR6_TETUR